MATRSSKGKGVAMASATDREDSDASLSNASSFVDNHAPVEDTFQPLEDEEINEGEGGAVNEGSVVNEGEGPSGDQPLHAGPSEDHPSHGDQAVEVELRSVHSDEHEEAVATGKKFKHYNHETDKQNPVFDTGMIFSDCKVTFTSNEKYKLKAVCKAVSCPWQIYVAWKNPTSRSLVVKYYNLNHNCVRVFENTQASSKWLRDKFLPRIQSNPKMPPKSIVNAASSEFKVGISRMKAYRAKVEVLRIIEGSVAEQYAML
ncbi:unnamed protein product [Prunus armeniaca]|uniref:Transposase MuDR plant domain-containing protein n=1 Tax=Prunus armeniaca TaxID=36596 RepID=A0A6J5X8T8_PRUAR|nr:unnamed protein product [Prunus armeniaca]CAB4308963.1 unnamed protein product [Prunus armeniaca]